MLDFDVVLIGTFEVLLATGRFLTVQPGFMVKLPLRLKALPVSLTNSHMPVGIITPKDP
jgi:hypothetical protein